MTISVPAIQLRDGRCGSFPYAPLNTSKAEIRLIYRQPHLVTGDEITCELCVADLDHSSLSYETLSYEWGSPSD